MDNLRFKLNNKIIDFKLLKSFNENSSSLIVPSDRNIIEIDKINSCFKIYNRKALNKKSIDKQPFLNLIYRANSSETVVIITGSVRKWYFGNKSIKELTKWQFQECIAELGNLIFKDFNAFMDANVYKVEIGATFKVKKELGLRILCNAYSHRDYKKRKNYPGETLYFTTEDEKNGVIIYNKGLEMKKNGLISKKAYTKISENLMLIRLEVIINNRSHASYFKDNDIKTINDLITRWQDLRNFWRKQIGNIKFIEYLNEKEIYYLQNKERGIYIDYLACKGVEHLGLDLLYGLLESLEEDTNRRYKITNTILSKLNKLQGDKVNSTKNVVAKMIAKEF